MQLAREITPIKKNKLFLKKNHKILLCFYSFAPNALSIATVSLWPASVAAVNGV